MTPARPDRGDPGVPELLAPSPTLGIPIPAYSGRSLPNVVASVVRAVGGPEGGDPPLAPPLTPDRDPFAGRRAEGPVLVLLADGLGWTSFDRWRHGGGRPWAARWGRRARPITTVFPTTTVPAVPRRKTVGAPETSDGLQAGPTSVSAGATPTGDMRRRSATTPNPGRYCR